MKRMVRKVMKWSSQEGPESRKREMWNEMEIKQISQICDEIKTSGVFIIIIIWQSMRITDAYAVHDAFSNCLLRA